METLYCIHMRPEGQMCPHCMRACTCPRLKVGWEITDSKDWNPNCAEHGLGSVWYQSDEQKERRASQATRLRELQAQAREARKNARINE